MTPVPSRLSSARLPSARRLQQPSPARLVRQHSPVPQVARQPSPRPGLSLALQTARPASPLHGAREGLQQPKGSCSPLQPARRQTTQMASGAGVSPSSVRWPSPPTHAGTALPLQMDFRPFAWQPHAECVPESHSRTRSPPPCEPVVSSSSVSCGRRHPAQSPTSRSPSRVPASPTSVLRAGGAGSDALCNSPNGRLAIQSMVASPGSGATGMATTTQSRSPTCSQQWAALRPRASSPLRWVSTDFVRGTAHPGSQGPQEAAAAVSAALPSVMHSCRTPVQRSREALERIATPLSRGRRRLRLSSPSSSSRQSAAGLSHGVLML